MISFIVIGRNEGWKLTQCLKSIESTIHDNELGSFEIIYVDSDSNDDSIERATKFELVRVFKLKGSLNAAIARNIGASNSKGKALFFIDGDMEIIPEFLRLVYSEEKGLLFNFVSGQWINHYYNSNDQIIGKDDFKNIEKDKTENVTGGLFLIKKEKWDLVGGMNVYFKIGEDHDLGLRLSEKGLCLLRKKELAAIHHTISYLNEKRIWLDFFRWNHLYTRSVLYREHIFNKFIYKLILRNDYTAIILMLCLISFFISNQILLLLLVFYIVINLLRVKFSIVKSFYIFLRDISVILGLFFFFPSRKQNFVSQEIHTT